MPAPSRRLVRIQILMTLAATVILIICVLVSYKLGLLNRADHYLFDAYFNWRGPQPASGDVVLVLMDQDSAAELERKKASWSRKQLAGAIDNLSRAGAEIIGLDMIFLSPDADPETDRLLAKAIENGNNVVLARGSSTHGGELASIDAFQEVAIGDGFIDFFLDGDEVLRRIRYLNARPMPDGGLELLPSFSLELARAYLNLEFNFDFSQKKHLLMGDPRGGHLLLPQPDLIVNYKGNYSIFPGLSFADVVLGRFQPDSVKGKLVIIGSSLATEKDVFSTPFTRFQKPSNAYQDSFGGIVQDVLASKDLGLACHAHAVETLLTETFIDRMPVRYILLFTFAVGISGLLFYLPQINMLFEIILLAAGLILLTGAGYGFFLFRSVWMDIAPMAAVFLLQFFSGLVVQKVFDKRKTALVTDIFGKFVSYSVVEELISGNMDVSLDGRHQELTILFSDLRGFTTLSEELGARNTGILLNTYFSKMIPVVFRHDGTMDKLMGDAIMAFFGAPAPVSGHPARAADAALDMLRTLEDLKRSGTAEGVRHLNVGIGLNTGVVTVGNLGSDQFMDYTIIGDAVNLASRLEGLNRVYGTRIIVSQFTAVRLSDTYVLRDLDRVRVKGKTEVVNLYELMGIRDEMTPDRMEFLRYFHEGLHAFRECSLDTARRFFSKGLNIAGHDVPTSIYLNRIVEAEQNQQKGGLWDCVTVYDHK